MPRQTSPPQFIICRTAWRPWHLNRVTYVLSDRFFNANVTSWPIPDSDQVHTSFIQMAAPLMVRNVMMGVRVAF